MSILAAIGRYLGSGHNHALQRRGMVKAAAGPWVKIERGCVMLLDKQGRSGLLLLSYRPGERLAIGRYYQVAEGERHWWSSWGLIGDPTHYAVLTLPGEAPGALLGLRDMNETQLDAWADALADARERKINEIEEAKR